MFFIAHTRIKYTILYEIRETVEHYEKSARNLGRDALVTNMHNAIKLIASLIRRHTNLRRQNRLLPSLLHHALHKYLITASHVRDYSDLLCIRKTWLIV